MSAGDACDRLDDWIERRGEIAHGMESPDLMLTDVNSYENFLRQTLGRTDSAVETLLSNILPDFSWSRFATR
jgi:hypothetical protein